MAARRKVNLEKVPQLPGWMTFDQIAEALDVSEQMVSKMALQYDQFTTLHFVGKKTVPRYLVSTDEVMALKLERKQLAEAAQRAADAAAAEADRLWRVNKRPNRRHA